MSTSHKQKLILHLENLKKQGHTNCTLNIDLVLECLILSESSTPKTSTVTDVRVDGGSF